jgi:Arc/MetJ family transcription regulator
VRTTLSLDDTLLAEPEALTGVKKETALVREALKALIAQDSARRLALLGGSDQDAEAGCRPRPDPD